jgi:hypothetical protein
MNAAELKTTLERNTEEATALSALWSLLIGPSPELRQFNIWCHHHGFQATQSAIERTAAKFSKLNGQMDSDYMLRYCSSVAKEKSAHGANPQVTA